MNRFILSILIVLFPLKIWGQLFPVSDHYLYDALSINPAFAGCHNALSATILYRNQWIGFKDAPKSQMISVHAPIDKNKIGLGLLIENNNIGIYKETSIIGNYAFRRNLFEGKLSLGLGFGITINNIAWNELDAADADDPELINNPSSAIFPTFSIGAYYYTKKYYIGFSLPMFLSHELDKSTGKYLIKNDFSAYNYFFTGGCEVNLNNNLKFLPSLLIKYHPNSTVQTDYNAQFCYNNWVWLGIGYRNKDVLIGLIQFKLNYQFKIVYSYDYNIGNIRNYINNSHEIGLNYIFCYKRKVKGPRQF
jgi:type IX secretion system PorP/SprF family membrane protein